ncbi:MAG: phosphoglycerate mutase family protein [Candidatus Staskawiczbacteria bacterium]|jgi:broad specificity phosphatase PhoE
MKLVKVAVIRHGKKEKIPDCGQGTTSWGIQARLTEAGIATAEQVARRLKALLPGCTTFGCSPLIRAQETIFVIMREMGIVPAEFADHIRYHPNFWSRHPSVWYMDVDPAAYSNGAVYNLRRTEVEEEGNITLNAIQDMSVLAGSGNEKSVICVSHGGPLDAAIMMAKRQLGRYVPITDLKEGEGAIFVFDDHVATMVDVEDFLQES